MIKTFATVIGVVVNKDEILLLKRTANRHTSPDKWQPVSGYLGEREAAEDAVLREVKEETNLDGKIVKKGKVFEITDDWGRWIIIVFLIKAENRNIKIDRSEHTDAVWIKPQDINKYDLVKGVKKDLEVVGLL